MLMDVLIRRFEPRDRAAIREIACDTADRGAPIERIFPDREVAADLLTAYYTDDEPDAAWVAVLGERVVGYVIGCVETRRSQRLNALRIIPRTVWRGILRGVLTRQETWQLAHIAWRTFWRGGYARQISLTAYPAHLHVNLREGFRGQGLAQQMVERFLEQLREARVLGLHVSVRGDNDAACRLFQRLGFTELGRYPLVLPDDHDQHHWTILYGLHL